MLRVKDISRNLTIDIDFSSNFCVMLGDSGTGKTFLFKCLSEYFSLNDVSYTLINSSNVIRSLEELKFACSKSDVLLLDNTDLYLTKEMVV